MCMQVCVSVNCISISMCISVSVSECVNECVSEYGCE